MNSSFWGLRLAILLTALLTLIFVNTIWGILLICSFFFSFLFRLRGRLLLSETRQSNYWELAGLLLVLANALIIAFALYESPQFYWIDTVMHFWGGAFAGYWALLSDVTRHVAQFSIRRIIIVIALSAFIGVVWEFAEWTSDTVLIGYYKFDVPKSQSSNSDTMTDLTFDVIGGGLIAAMVSQKARGQR